MSRDEYINMVEAAKRYIEDGDIYQINLSQRFTIGSRISPIECFLRMFHVQQVPFGCYIDFGDFQLCSGSMELFLRRSGGVLTTGPIKGTSERGLNPESDTIKKAKLVSSEKERAENLMIVDLMRNDLSKVCRAGSVKVSRLFDVESYATLYQLVSEVEGKLANGIGVSGIVRNIFPPGSVTGAPKRRVLQIIDGLEPHYRGPYCGAVGVFFPDGDFTLSVGIRLLITDPGKATFWVGGGIVWDSDPAREYEETLLKSMAIKKALGLYE
jgi:anthranilate/para-aminobenzoate synthase component I